MHAGTLESPDFSPEQSEPPDHTLGDQGRLPLPTDDQCTASDTVGTPVMDALSGHPDPERASIDTPPAIKEHPQAAEHVTAQAVAQPDESESVGGPADAVERQDESTPVSGEGGKAD